jgi:transposase
MGMARPSVFSAEEKARIVLSILAGQTTFAEAAQQAKVSEQSVGNRKREFLEPGKTGLRPAAPAVDPRGIS